MKTQSHHLCPIDGCKTPVLNSHVMCHSHWFLVPLPLRQEVNRLYAEMPGSIEHSSAISKAIQSVKK